MGSAEYSVVALIGAEGLDLEWLPPGEGTIIAGIDGAPDTIRTCDFTWVKIRWKLPDEVGQFWVEFDWRCFKAVV